MKIKPIILMLVFIMSYLLIAIPYSDNVNATTTNYSETLTGQIVNNQIAGNLCDNYANFYIDSKKMSGTTFKVDNVGKSGKGFNEYYGTGYFNLTYSKTSYLTNFSVFVYPNLQYAGVTTSFIFYNFTLGISKPIYSFYLGALGNGSDRFYDSYVVVDWNGWWSSWTKIYFEILNTIGDIQIGCSGSAGNKIKSSSATNGTAIYNEYRIDRIYMSQTGASSLCYLDFFNVTLSSSYVSGGGTSPSDFSQYRTIGSLPTEELSFGGSYPVIEKRYENDFSGTIYGIDIPMFSDNTVWDGHSWVSSLPNWSLGFNIGINGMTYTPDLVYNVSVYGISDPLHIYRFDFSSSPLILDNEKILIEFYSAVTSSSGNYFYPALTSYDSDLDGVIQSKRGALTYFDGDYNGQLTDNNHDFAYLIYYEGAMGEIPEEETTYNFLTVYGGRYTNTSGQPLFYKNDTVSMGWGISDMTVSNIIRIKYAGVNITLQGFPYTLYSPKGAIAYCPENNGNYTVYLYINSVKTITKYFDVISNPNAEENAYQIHSIPPSTYDYTQYTIKYNYINPVGYEGRIALFKNYYDVSNYTRNVYNRTIDGNITGGQFLYLPIDLEKNDYWQLFVKVGSSFIPKGNYHMHYLMKSGLSSYMSIDYGQRFGDTAKIGFPITVTGYHPYILQNVNVFVNGLPIQYVGTTQSFSFTYTPVKKGTHIFELSVRLDNGTNYILATDECIVYESNETDGGGGGIVPSGWKIDPPFSYFFGIAIIILTTMSPLIVIKGINRDFNLSTIPQFLYLIMGVIGFIISIVLGFFPAWSLLVLVVIAVLILAILWLKGNSNQVG